MRVNEYKALKWIQIPLRTQSDEAMVESAQEERKRRYQEQKDRLLNEITAMEQLKENRNIVQIEDHSVYERPNVEGYDILIRMEYLTPLLVIYPIGLLEQGIVVQLEMDICAALAVCESKNMFNIDLKPTNVFIDPQGNFKLNDFWITKALADGEAATTRNGARSYLPPEMFRGVQKGDPTVDIYALSLMLYRYVNDGHPPFFYETDGAEMPIRNEKAIQRRIQGEAVPPARHASTELNRILLKAMAPNPADRYQSADEMRQDLACLPVTLAEKIHVIPSVPTPKHGTKRKPWMIAVGIALTVGIGGIGFQS